MSTTAFSTFLYGVSIKPIEFTLAYTESEEIKPMFGPSGVSIGHNLP